MSDARIESDHHSERRSTPESTAGSAETLSTNQEKQSAAVPPRRWLTPGVFSVGAASFFSDAGHEITTSVLPSFITVTLRGSAGALGLIEGISDALTGLMKLLGGSLANDETRRIRLASGGYVVTAVATSAIGLTTAVWQAGALRAVAWSARGIRSPARDALLTSLAPEEAYGRAFGLERAGDNLGAVVGPLLAAALVGVIGIRSTMLLAIVPGALAAIAITFAATEARNAGATARRRARLELRALRNVGIGRPLVPIVFFELGNCATTLLILRATHLLQHGGRSLTAATSVAVLIYAAHNLFGAAVAYIGGHWIDKAGPRAAFAAGALLFTLAYVGFALPFHSWPLLLVFFSLAGSGIGLAETAESTLFAQSIPEEIRGSGFGLLGAIQSGGALASSAVVGLLWSAFSPTVAFIYAASWMALSLGASGWLRARA